MAELPNAVEGTGHGVSDVRSLLRPLSARSLIASALLGSHPPRLPGNLLVALAERFDIAPGTARVALSRMVDRGELQNDHGTYELAGDLLERQHRQDASRTPPPSAWDGDWEQAVIVVTGRSASERSRLRAALTALNLGERREGLWMRPANLDPARQPGARAATGGLVEWYRVCPAATVSARALAGEVFDLDEWATTATALCDALASAQARLPDERGAVAEGFTLASAALRHLVHDPQLPADLQPDRWPSDDLRTAYAAFEHDYQDLLRAFFRSQR